MWKSPFSPSASKPGHGKINISILPPQTPVLHELAYQYPLKLIAPDPVPPTQSHRPAADTKGSPFSSDANDTNPPSLIHTVFLLTYGGGIVAGDTVDLHVTLAPRTRLNLLTQGSTKVFKTPDPKLLSYQNMNVDLYSGAALLYLPDPVQPFKDAAFRQGNRYSFCGWEDAKGSEGYNLCACDWVSSGRAARGENWDFWSYESRNEIWGMPDPSASMGTEKKRLLLRDNLLLHPPLLPKAPAQPRGKEYGIFGTLILHGGVFEGLGKWFLDEFEGLPRLGAYARSWNTYGDSSNGVTNGDDSPSMREKWRTERQTREVRDGLMWSAAKVRGFVIVKFAAREVEGARSWLRDMIVTEGSVVRGFGERGVLCLK